VNLGGSTSPSPSYYTPLSYIRRDGTCQTTDNTNRFWHRRLKKTPETFRRRFVQIIDDYVKSVVKEVEYRSQARILDMESYFVLRRLTIGAYPIFAALEMDLDIPDEVRKHPILRQLEISTIDLLIISNVSSFLVI